MGRKDACHHACCQRINVQMLACTPLASHPSACCCSKIGAPPFQHGTCHPGGARCGSLLASPYESSLSCLKGGRCWPHGYACHCMHACGMHTIITRNAITQVQNAYPLLHETAGPVSHVRGHPVTLCKHCIGGRS